MTLGPIRNKADLCFRDSVRLLRPVSDTFQKGNEQQSCTGSFIAILLTELLQNWSEPTADPAPLCPRLLCNWKNWKRGMGGGGVIVSLA